MIEGRHIIDIPSFYAEINRVFMVGETWQLGESLDALNDLLFGSYGAIAGADDVAIVWKDMERSRAALGAAVTLELLRSRLGSRPVFNGRPLADQIAQLEQGGGTTYFDIVMEIFADHPKVRIRAA